MLKHRRVLVLLACLLVFQNASARQAEEARVEWKVVRYDVTATPSDASSAQRSLRVRARLEARNVGTAPGRTLTARITPEAKIDSVKVGDAQGRFVERNETRTKLKLAQLTLPTAVAPGATVSVVYEYTLPVVENNGLASISPEGAQFLPLAFWYPTPNSPISPRGSDYAPTRITVSGLASGQTVVSSGAASGENSYEQSLNSQPFFLTGNWETVAGANDARGVSAHLAPGASAEEQRQAEALISLAAEARAFYAGLLGPAPDVPVRLVGVRRGAGFDMAGTVLLDASVFRRTQLDSVTTLRIADAVARLWVGGRTGVEGEGAGAVREGLSRYLATLFLEKRFGPQATAAERMRMALLYAPIARRDAPLGQLSPAYETYFNAVANKGALVWRLVADSMGRDEFLKVLRARFGSGAAAETLTLASLRARLVEAGGERTSRLLPLLFDQPTDTDLLVGLPQRKAEGWVSVLRNTGSFDVEATVRATTETGERLDTTVRIPAKDFAEARFQTPAKIVRVEIDPEKLYPQLDYSNDIAPQGPGVEEVLEQARIALGARQPERAETLAREALARAGNHGAARVVLARAHLEQNRLDEAEREFRAALAEPLPTPSTLAWAHIGLGEIAMRRNRAAEAAKHFGTAVDVDAEYASTLNARAARIRAESAASAPPVDEQVKAAAQRLDAAILTGKSSEIEPLVVAGELRRFTRGLVTTQPAIWQTRVLRTESAGPNRTVADVALTVRAGGRDQTGTAVFVFARTPAGWKLADVQFFEVRETSGQ